MQVGGRSGRELCGGGAVGVDDPLGGEEPLDAHRPSGVDPGGADAHLSAQTQSVPVRETRRRVVEHAGRVHALEEALGLIRVFSDDDVRVGRSVRVNVVDCLLHVLHHLYGALQVAVLSPEGFGGRRPESDALQNLGTSVDLDVAVLQGPADAVERSHVFVDFPVQQQGLHSVAGGGVVAFGVDSYIHSLLQVGMFINIHVAYSFSMSQNGNVSRLILDVLDHVGRSPWND